MNLFRGLHTCALGTHILLEIGAPYEAEKIDVAGRATHEPWFQAINPKGKVPTLVRNDGSVLTEFGAIATWLALAVPAAGLLPDNAERRARACEVMDHAMGTLHGQAFARLFMPERFEPQDPVDQMLGLGQRSVMNQGRAMAEQGFAILDDRLAAREWAAGDRFGIADAALFHVERWAPGQEIALPANVRAYFDRVRARPAVGRVLAIWGEQPGA